MLAIDPRLVRADRLRPGSAGDGVDGDPTRATAELGRPGVELIVAPDRGRGPEIHHASLRRRHV